MGIHKFNIETVMIIITRTDGHDLTRVLKLEGKLLGPWIGELESACGTP